MDVITICKRKRPVGHGRWRAYCLATDAVGTWAFTPAGSTFVGTSAAGAVGTCAVAQDAHGRGRHCVALLPRSKWFVAQWVLGSEFLVNVDISTPPARSGTHWSFDDLELDPVLRRDQSFGVDDEDEFAAACAAGMISDHERDMARRTVDSLHLEFIDSASPLVRTGQQFLHDAVSLDLAPLVLPVSDPIAARCEWGSIE